jgi:hypothetical protein
MLAMWNSIGNKRLAMARDFPEDKYDFKLQKDQRTFAQTLLHVAGVDYLGIPAKVNGDSSGKPNGVPLKANSRRSEATLAG